MKALVVDVVAVFATLFLACILFSVYAMYRRHKLKRNQRLQLPPASELRKNRVPVIESTPFWVPSYIGHMVDIEVQPTLENLTPKFSTPKPRRRRSLTENENPQLKFSVKYNARRSALTVDLLESKHLGKGNLVHDVSVNEPVAERSFLSETGVFSAIELSPSLKKDSMPAVRRTRKNSYEFQMSYEELQLQCLQFSVMAFDEYSRQKVIGDVILPLADLTSQGVDVTRELIMWREIQTIEKRKSTKTGRRDENQNLIESGIEDGAEPSEALRRCSPS